MRVWLGDKWERLLHLLIYSYALLEEFPGPYVGGGGGGGSTSVPCLCSIY
jgi:hypothetical protein